MGCNPRKCRLWVSMVFFTLDHPGILQTKITTNPCAQLMGYFLVQVIPTQKSETWYAKFHVSRLLRTVPGSCYLVIGTIQFPRREGPYLVYKWHMLPIRWLYATYHLFQEPEKSLEKRCETLLLGVCMFRSELPPFSLRDSIPPLIRI